ncbi:MAG TPA: DUF4136 domain-containing protein [Gammaproteobacteria bacterium]|nr:DUF4136 domain-containing protein [Gammaproteobacteria bacterium]
MKSVGTLGLVVIAGLALLGGCATLGPQIQTDYDPSVDFSRFQTFAFMDREERGVTRTYDTLGDQRVMEAVTRELAARGYRKVEENPDLLVNFSMSTESVEEIRSVPSSAVHPGYAWRSGFYYPWPAYSYPYAYETWVDRYEEGTLYIDLVDAERKQLVWEARAVGRVTQATREDPAGALDDAVAQIFERYPFTAGPGDAGPDS